MPAAAAGRALAGDDTSHKERDQGQGGPSVQLHRWLQLLGHVWGGGASGYHPNAVGPRFRGTMFPPPRR